MNRLRHFIENVAVLNSRGQLDGSIKTWVDGVLVVQGTGIKQLYDGTLRVTWVHSSIGHNAAARGTIRALGLHRLHETVDVDDTPANRGMIRRVAFLLEVTGPARPAKSEDSGS